MSRCPCPPPPLATGLTIDNAQGFLAVLGQPNVFELDVNPSPAGWVEGDTGHCRSVVNQGGLIEVASCWIGLNAVMGLLKALSSLIVRTPVSK